jgi:hypothetical protein
MSRSPALRLGWLAAAAWTWAFPLHAQDWPRIALGFGVDTTGSPRHEIFTLWRAYLRDRPDSVHRSPYWSWAEQREWPTYDMTSGLVYQGVDEPGPFQFRATVVEIEPAVPGDSTTYVIRTLFARTDSASGAILPLALQRVFAVRDGGRWALATALPRLTATWPRTTVGRITFIYWPDHHFDRAQATRSARFVDSLARVLGVDPPRSITYILAPSPDDVSRILGLDFLYPLNGFTLAADRIVLSGIPGYGEWYPHELSHLVMSPLVPESPTWLFNEGGASWFGGSRGLTYEGLVHELAVTLCERPRITLDSVVSGNMGAIDSLSRGAGAVLYQLAYQHGGIPAVRLLISASAHTPPQIYTVLEQATGLDPEPLGRAWRRAIVGPQNCAGTGAPS